MKIIRYIIFVFIFGSISGFVPSLAQETTGKEQDVPIQDTHDSTNRIAMEDFGVAEETVLSPILAFFDVAPTQPLSRIGLRFEVEILNPSDKAITILNPLDYYHATLLDQAGNTIKLPQVPNRAQFNGPAKAFPKSPILPFKVLELSIGTEKLPSEDWGAQSFTLPPQQSLKIQCGITEVVTADSTSIAPISAGQYQLRVTLGIHGTGENKKAKRLLFSKLVKTKLSEGTPKEK